MHILEEWRIRDVEQKAELAHNRFYELDAIRSDVGSLERADREICSLIAGLRDALDTTLDRVAQLEASIEELKANDRLGGAAGCTSLRNDHAEL
jgi:hypothetical protein